MRDILWQAKSFPGSLHIQT